VGGLGSAECGSTGMEGSRSAFTCGFDGVVSRVGRRLISDKPEASIVLVDLIRLGGEVEGCERRYSFWHTMVTAENYAILMEVSVSGINVMSRARDGQPQNMGVIACHPTG